jgi:hypothetical protein
MGMSLVPRRYAHYGRALPWVNVGVYHYPVNLIGPFLRPPARTFQPAAPAARCHPDAPRPGCALPRGATSAPPSSIRWPLPRCRCHRGVPPGAGPGPPRHRTLDRRAMATGIEAVPRPTRHPPSRRPWTRPSIAAETKPATVQSKRPGQPADRGVDYSIGFRCSAGTVSRG